VEPDHAAMVMSINMQDCQSGGQAGALEKGVTSGPDPLPFGTLAEFSPAALFLADRSGGWISANLMSSDLQLWRLHRVKCGLASPDSFARPRTRDLNVALLYRTRRQVRQEFRLIVPDALHRCVIPLEHRSVIQAIVVEVGGHPWNHSFQSWRDQCEQFAGTRECIYRVLASTRRERSEYIHKKI
jgi:hypothetical protein